MTASEHEFECCNNHLMQKAESKIKINSVGGELEGGGHASPDVGVGSVGLLLSSEGICRIGKLSMKNRFY